MNSVYIDKFLVPAASKDEFVQTSKKTQQFLRNLPGHISSASYIRQEPDGNYTVITTAVWQDEQSIAKVQEALTAEYHRTGFDRHAFTQRLGIQRDGQIYQPM